MPTRHNRIQVTEDRQLAAALRAAAPHLPADLPRSRQVRELAIAGARHLSSMPPGGTERKQMLEELADQFRHPETALWDPNVLREGKRDAWPIR